MLWVFLATNLLAGEAVQQASVTSRVGRSGGDKSFNPVFSADGRFVVFVSQANNLATNDDFGLHLDVFARELATGKTTLVSVNRSGTGGAGTDADYPAISADGRLVTFASTSGNLAGIDTNDTSDVFVRDLTSATTTLVSVDAYGVAPVPRSGHPLISGDGRRVFLESRAYGLVTNADYSLGTPDVFVRNLAEETMVLVSVNQDGTKGTAGVSAAGSKLCCITPDGRFAAFLSTGTNLTPVWTPLANVYVRDLSAGITLCASSNLPTCFGTNAYQCLSASLSSDGRFVAFKATANPAYLWELTYAIDPVLLFRHDLTSRQTILIASNVTDLAEPQISADGRFVAYDDGTNVLVWDGQIASNILVSVNLSSGPADGISKSPAMTPDARSIVFLSSASDLVTNTVNGSFQVYVHDLVAGSTRLVTLNRDGQVSSADHEFIEPAISADGRYVAFESDDDELVANDFNRATDVFVRDLTANNTMLISERDPALPASTGVNHCDVPTGNCLSADGRFLVFSSLDNTLVTGDTNGWRDVFVRDLFTGSNRMVGVWTNPVVNPILSANGRYVLFTKPASLFDSVQDGDIYRYDLWGGTSVLVNVRWDGSGPANKPALASGVSADGQHVLFVSAASDLVNQPGGLTRNVYLRDMQLGTNQLLSASLTSGYANGDSSSPMLSPDQGWIAYTSSATDLVTNGPVDGYNPPVYLRDLLQNRTFLVPLNTASYPPFAFSGDSRFFAFKSSYGLCLYDLLLRTNQPIDFYGVSPSLDATGRFLAYQTAWVGGTFPTNQIMLWNRLTGLSDLVSVSRSGSNSGDRVGNGSAHPLISPDGRFIIFSSRAYDLVDNDSNGVTDLFVRDLLTSNTVLISSSVRTQSSGNDVSGPWYMFPQKNTTVPYQFGPDGRTVVFQSYASDLVEGDYNDKRDIFILRLGAADSDGDSMDDDWEMAFFGTLSRDGTGDFDGDGMEDLDEFRAGTDPTNEGSVLRVMTLTSVSGSGTTLLWSAVPGKNYRVQYRDDVTAAGWTDLPVPFVLNGSTASAVDSTASGRGQRYYRVLAGQ
jgi:Tol biopolymer transport system component